MTEQVERKCVLLCDAITGVIMLPVVRDYMVRWFKGGNDMPDD